MTTWKNTKKPVHDFVVINTDNNKMSTFTDTNGKWMQTKFSPQSIAEDMDTLRNTQYRSVTTTNKNNILKSFEIFDTKDSENIEKILQTTPVGVIDNIQIPSQKTVEIRSDFYEPFRMDAPTQ